jgi:hypothetical protein
MRRDLCLARYRANMVAGRRCSKTGCGLPAVATLTYVYADSTAVLGPLATYAEPHCYDLCARHGERLTAPIGWEVLRLMPEAQVAAPSHDDLLAIADAVREAGRGGDRAPDGSLSRESEESTRPELGRRGHLRALPAPRS